MLTCAVSQPRYAPGKCFGMLATICFGMLATQLFQYVKLATKRFDRRQRCSVGRIARKSHPSGSPRPVSVCWLPPLLVFGMLAQSCFGMLATKAVGTSRRDFWVLLRCHDVRPV